MEGLGLAGGLGGRASLGSKEHLDWLKMNAAKIITVQ